MVVESGSEQPLAGGSKKPAIVGWMGGWGVRMGDKGEEGKGLCRGRGGRCARCVIQAGPQAFALDGGLFLSSEFSGFPLCST